MKIFIDKELFQWEKNRKIYIELSEKDIPITYVQFYNSKSKNSPEVKVINNTATIPNYLLQESLPIMAVACSGAVGEGYVIGRREFKVIKRAKPEFYVPDSDEEVEHIIYDGGMEV